MPAAIDLTGSVAVVTGVCGRLGPVWVDALLGAGAEVVGLDVRDTRGPELRAVLDRHDPKRFTALVADVTDTGSLRRALDDCLERAGEPTILINNAGVDSPPSADGTGWRFEDIPDEVSGGVLAVNAQGTLRMCQVFGSRMARHGGGSIVNIGSMYGGLAPDPRMYEHLPVDPPFLKPPAYGMSKAGVAALSRYLAALWGPAGVRVNTLSPGGVLGAQDPVFREKFDARVPLRRMARAEDLTGPLLFLASDLSRYVTGTELAVDGGFSCW
ncbi:SDR family oxidoreductase [Streptomyces sp. SBC-4]|nr:SDR family oxidoreductase [Streptomyces sp. SBC-4]MDV5142778.1 SDR family oxidoreductase [Streptomyces sp. SBC-4]